MILTSDRHKVEYTQKTVPAAAATVVLCHGITADRHEFDGLFVKAEEKLGLARFNTIRFDYRGHGLSKMPQEDMTIAGEELDLTAVVEYCRESTSLPIVIVAASFGALSAARLSNSHAESIKAIALWNPVTNPRATFLEGRTDWSKEHFNDQTLEEAAARGYLYLDDYRVGTPLIAEMFVSDFRPVFAAITQPLLVIHGDADQIVPVELTRSTFREGDTAKVSITPGAAHGFPGSQESVIDDTVSWLRELF